MSFGLLKKELTKRLKIILFAAVVLSEILGNPYFITNVSASEDNYGYIQSKDENMNEYVQNNNESLNKYVQINDESLKKYILSENEQTDETNKTYETYETNETNKTYESNESSESNETNETDDTDDDTYSYIDEIYEMLGIEDVDNDLKKVLPIEISFSEITKAIASGDTKKIWFIFETLLTQALCEELPATKAFLIQIVSVVLIGSLFSNLSNSFGNSFVSENGFYISYMIVTSIMLSIFCMALDIVKNTLSKILMVIRIIVPVYALSIAFLGNGKTSVGMYQLTLVAIWCVEAIIINIVLPLIKYYVIISLVNNINKEDSFSKLGDLLKNIVSWLLKTIVFFIGGLNVIKGLVDPQIDAIGRTAVNKVISVIPGGGMVSVLSGTFLGAGMVVKNSIGITGIIILVVIVMIPVVKIFVIRFMVKLSMALIQPLGERRYIEGIDSMTTGLTLLLNSVASGVILFVLTLAVMAYAVS